MSKLESGLVDGKVWLDSYQVWFPLNIKMFSKFFFMRLFNYADWHIAWGLFIFCALFYAKKIWLTNLKYLFLICLVNMLMIINIFYQPSLYPSMIDGCSISRFVMHFMPVVVYFLALVIGSDAYTFLTQENNL